MWKLSTVGKIRAASALVVVFLLVLATNLMDNNHFKIVQGSITSIYEDRLVAKDYIYKISRQLQLKQYVVHQNDRNQIENIYRMADDSIKVLINKFDGTKLTKQEVRYFESLKSNLNRLGELEQRLLKGETPNNIELPSINLLENSFLVILEDLDKLSQIQLEEGKRETMSSKRAIDTSNFISRLEIGVLIFIGLMLQLLIFLKPVK
ncbi:MAG: hypothetical protein ACI9GZ_001160 [Bacteroidia bacterium]|jgi:hypothetical protein